MKKVSLWLVVLSMLAAMAPSYTAFAEKTWINIEAEDGVYSEYFTEYENNAASGGGGIYIGGYITDSEGNRDGSLTPGADWTFDIPEEGQYDAWALVLKPNKDWMSRYKFAFNNDPLDYYLNTQTSVNPFLDTEGNQLRFPVYELDHGVGSGYFREYLCWIKLAENKEFSAGENTLHYEISSRPSDKQMYLNSIDCIRIVPSEWNWTAKADLSEPAPNTEPEPEPEVNVFEQEENGLIWMEAEEAYAPDFYVQNSDGASSGKYLAMGKKVQNEDGSNNNGLTFSADFNFSVKKQGTYDIWMLVQRPNENHLSRYMTSLDGEEPHYITDIWGGYAIKNSPSIFLGSVVGSQFENYWVRVEVGRFLDESEHSFEFSIGARPLNDGFYITTLDCVAVVPSSWNWLPDETSDKAKPPIGGYSWIELENPQEVSNFGKIVRGTTGGSVNFGWTDIVSNKSALTADGVVTDGNEKLSYKFNLKNDGNYDIYYLGTNCATTYLSRLWWGIDNPDIFTDDQNHENQLAADGENISAEMFKIGDHGLYWQRMATNKPLNAGEHTLYLEYVNRQEAPNHYMRADCVIVVPSEWNWQMPATAQEPAQTAVELDVLEQFYALQAAYADGVSGNIENLDVRGSAGSKFIYESKNPDIIADDGTVTHPGIGEGMVRGAVGFTANKELKGASGGNTYKYISSETVSRFTILEAADIDYSGFEVVYRDGSPISGALVSGATIDASVSIKTNNLEIADGAMLALAVYKDGALVKVSGNEIMLSADYQTLSASLTLPEDGDMSDYSVKAFLWDGFATGNPYCEALEY